MSETNETTAGAENTTDPTLTSSTQTTTPSSKRKRKKKPAKPHILSQITIRDPPWSYIHLQHLTGSNKSTPLDEITAQLHLTAALTQFLGLHGASIPFDMLKISGQDLWIRLAAEDRSALIAAAGGWVSSKGEGWRVKGWSAWDAGVMNGREGGQDIFAD